MNKTNLFKLAVCLAMPMALAAVATAEDNVVLTPGTLYEQNQKTRSQTVNITVALRKRIAGLEAQVVTLNEFKKTATYRLNELERKVEGMQKQITILHAKLAK